MSNTYAKYCPNVWLAKCEIEHQRGEIIQVANKYGKESDCEVHNLIVKNSNGYFYSITRCDGLNRQTYAERKAEKYQAWAEAASVKSNLYYEQSREGSEFLALGEPIKVGHHSEGRHRALFSRNDNRMRNSIAQSNKADEHKNKAAYWEHMTDKIDLSMPESIDYFAHELEKARACHQKLKDNPAARPHSMSLSYASKKVKDTAKNVELAAKLWATNETA